MHCSRQHGVWGQICIISTQLHHLYSSHGAARKRTKRLRAGSVGGGGGGVSGRLGLMGLLFKCRRGFVIKSGWMKLVSLLQESCITFSDYKIIMDNVKEERNYSSRCKCLVASNMDVNNFVTVVVIFDWVMNCGMLNGCHFSYMSEIPFGAFHKF